MNARRCKTANKERSLHGSWQCNSVNTGSLQETLVSSNRNRSCEDLFLNVLCKATFGITKKFDFLNIVFLKKHFFNKIAVLVDLLTQPLDIQHLHRTFVADRVLHNA